MKPILVLLCIFALPIIAPLVLGMLVAIGAALGFVVSAPLTLLSHTRIAKNTFASDLARNIALDAIYGRDRYERLRSFWQPKKSL